MQRAFQVYAGPDQSAVICFHLGAVQKVIDEHGESHIRYIELEGDSIVFHYPPENLSPVPINGDAPEVIEKLRRDGEMRKKALQNVRNSPLGARLEKRARNSSILLGREK